jgi:sarcosine oxidase subunit gamma
VDPFAARVAALPTGAGDVAIADRPGLGMATVMARAGGDVAGRIREAFRLELPAGPRSASAGGLTMVGTGPSTWLAVQERASPDWADELAAALDGVASVADQSSGYAVLRVAGAGARRMMSRGPFLDFDPARFGAGDAAVTLIAHMGAIVWQVDDTPTYDIAVFRSYAGSFWHWIETAAEGFGGRLVRAG